MSATPVETGIVEEACALVDAAAERAVPLRLLGGLTVRVLCPDLPARTRTGQDLDFASLGSARRGLTELLGERGYVGDKHFNALHGNKQLYFVHAESGRPVDVLVDRLEMCHTLEFGSRLTRLPYTLDPLDLLLTKLQIVELNEKDVEDCMRLLVSFPALDSDEPGTMDLRVFRAVVGDDWGWWRTATRNLDRLRALVVDGRPPLPGARLDPLGQLDAFARAAEDAPKTRRWKLRARVGERVRWYELPEEEAH